MANVSLSELKEFLRIDYPDLDDSLESLLNGEIQRAETITGRNYTDDEKDDYEVMSFNVKNAVMRAVATNISQSDDINSEKESVNASIYVYRSESILPAF